MNITITLDFKEYKKGVFDISANSEQIIGDCLKIVNEGLNLNLEVEKLNYCKSKREKQLISLYSTFKDNNIYTGDIIKFV